MAISAKAGALQANGHDVIRMGAGEPDFDTPAHILEAAHAALRDGTTRYTPVGGTPALKKAICQKLRRDNGLAYQAEEVTASAGGKQSLFNAFLATLNPGDEVILAAPYWVSYADIVALCQARAVVVPCGPESRYLLTAERLKEAITPATRAIVINSPANPTGMGLTGADLESLCAVLREHPNILIVSDDLYEHIVYDGFSFSNIPMVAPDLTERTLLVNGVSKAYRMTGFRLGYAAGPAALIRNMEIIQGQSTSNPSSISQAAAVAALTGPQECIWEMRAAFGKRQSKALSVLESIAGIRTLKPQGAFYLFPDVSDLYDSPRLRSYSNGQSRSEAFCEILLSEYGVAAVPGSAFGRDKNIRLSYAVSDEKLEQGLERLTRMTAELQSSQ